jgi:hypothetical protein
MAPTKNPPSLDPTANAALRATTDHPGFRRLIVRLADENPTLKGPNIHPCRILNGF